MLMKRYLLSMLIILVAKIIAAQKIEIGEPPTKMSYYEIHLSDNFIDTLMQSALPKVIQRHINEVDFCGATSKDYLINTNFIDTVFQWGTTEVTCYTYEKYVIANHKYNFNYTSNNQLNDSKYEVILEKAKVMDTYLIFDIHVFRIQAGTCGKSEGYTIVIKDWLLNDKYELYSSEEYFLSDLPSSLKD